MRSLYRQRHWQWRSEKVCLIHKQKRLVPILSAQFTVAWLSVLAIVLDQWTKWIASTHLNYADPVPVLPFLNWTLLHNYGAAFSFFLMLVAGNVIFYFFSRLCLDYLYFLVNENAKKMIILPMAIALILGGAIGNLLTVSHWVMSLTLFMSIIKTVTSLLLILQIVRLP
jgi:signal transduction histidine kinase